MGHHPFQRAVHGLILADNVPEFAQTIQDKGTCRQLKLLRKRIDDAIDAVYSEATDMIKESIQSALEGHDYEPKHELVDISEVVSDAFEVGFILDQSEMAKCAAERLERKHEYTYDYDDDYGSYVLFTVYDPTPTRYIAVVKSVYAIPCVAKLVAHHPVGGNNEFGNLQQHRELDVNNDDQTIALALAPDNWKDAPDAYLHIIGRISPLGNLSDGTFSAFTF